ncbi:hypothetical protein [Microbulbifer elongatus]|uniref:hypothetical protein n=1 Tax=Microbulbifer elongatus TaxID=86173 RepID=UPI001CFD1379|nr:hypothetical protein [Microbulbifer elongatus]
MNFVTVDVWDTLLRRRCHPDAIKMEAARYLISLLGEALPSKFRSPDEILSWRRSVELEIGLQAQSQGLDDEYEIKDVLTLLVEKVTGSAANAKLVDAALKFEFELELDVTYVDPEITSLIKSLSPSKCYFISDFYMGAEYLSSLLEKNGVNFLDGGISSCDVGLNKRSGRLFDWFLNEYKVELAESSHIHIGDNEWSDKKNPESKSINSIHFLPPEEHKLRLMKEKVYFSRERTSELIENEYKAELLDLDEFEAIGVEHAKLFYGFIDFIIRDANAKRLEKVLFFTREGEFFKRLYDCINESLPSWRKGPQSELLEVSRVATFFPSLREISLKELMRLWNLYSCQSVRSLFKSLGLVPDTYIEYFDKYQIELDQIIEYPWQDERVKKLFSDFGFLKHLSERQEYLRESIFKYFYTRGLSNDCGRVAIVDIGWRGTIQDNICYLFPEVEFTGYYLGLQVFLNDQPKNATKIAYGPDLNFDFRGESLLNAVAPLEMLCNSKNGSVVGFKEDEGDIRAVKKIDQKENKVFEEFTAKYQDGVEKAVKTISRLERKILINPVILRESAFNSWHSIIESPHPEIAKSYFSLYHNEDFGVGAVVDKSTVVTYSDILKAVFFKKNRQYLVAKIKDIQWVEGYKRRADLSRLRRLIFSLVLKLATVYKRFLIRRRAYSNSPSVISGLRAVFRI